jgi:hypothetical protein
VVKAYIDDLICVGTSELNCKESYETLIVLIQSLGLDVNWKKVCGPLRKITFLGVWIDCEERMLSLPENY